MFFVLNTGYRVFASYDDLVFKEVTLLGKKFAVNSLQLAGLTC